ncbi:L-lactate permease [Mobilicoccus massiliensis]|uniref:L-lactate permease n=1 Tax=Mobilicoccus massiliensis TaxID=1522310 RepID=UPI0006949F07|nr:L-lactate permease [Mobilicoccus massiliensis]
MTTLAAAAPILLACVALALGVSSLRSSLLGLAAAFALTPLAFPMPAADLLAVVGGWLPTLLEVLLILAGGILLSRLLEASGGQRVLAGHLAELAAGRVAAILLVVHGAVPFAESVTGFGVGVMVGVPLLLALGVSPMRAAIIALLGLVVVPWGSLGPGTLVAARMGGLDLTQFGVETAIVNGVVFVVSGVAAVVVAFGRARPVEVIGGSLSGLALWGAVWAANVLVGTPLAGVIGSVAVIAAHVGLGLATGRRLPRTDDLAGDVGLVRALTPYATLVAGLLVMSLALGATDGLASWLRSPGLWLPLTCLVAVLVLPFEPGQVRGVVGEAARTWLGVGVPTGAFLLLGVVMAATGMAGALAAAVATLGPAYLVVGPWIGALGGFVTGSNTGANSMFAVAQAEAARGLGVSVLTFLALTNSAAAAWTMAAPSRIEMAVRLAGEQLDRRRIMLVVLAVDVVIAIGLSLVALARL